MASYAHALLITLVCYYMPLCVCVCVWVEHRKWLDESPWASALALNAFQNHTILTQNIQYAVQMKALTIWNRHTGDSAAFILNSQYIMHLTATQIALLAVNGLTFT